MLQYLPITDPTLIFFVVLLIILVAPIVMSKLRIPHITAYSAYHRNGAGRRDDRPVWFQYPGA